MSQVMEYGWHLTDDTVVSVDAGIAADRCVRLHTGRSDFEGIDNDAIDFSQLENFINDDSDTTNAYFADTLAHNEVARAHAQSAQDLLGQPQPQAGQQQGVKLASAAPPAAAAAFGLLGSETTTVYVLPHSLPESPPDSGSEPPYSPQDHGGHSPHPRLGSARAHALQDMLLQPLYAGHPGAALHLDATLTSAPGPQLPPGPTHTLHLQGAGGETILVQHPVVIAAGPPPSMPPPVPSPQLPPAPPLTPQLQHSPLGVVCEGQGGVFPGLTTNANKKRKLSQDGRVHVKTEPGMAELSPDSSSNHTGVLDDDFGLDVSGDMYMDSSFQCIRFSPFQPTDWHVLCDQKFQELAPPKYQVVADKGFNFSNADDAFVCQKKNHFQITCHVKLLGDAQFVKTAEGFKKILSWQLHFYGVKTEATAQIIKVEQSQSDRSKKAFHPVQVELRPDEPIKKTVGRLHFSETTSNNMRKKGKPNPDQRYFYLVVGLHAHCCDDLDYPVVSHNSERIIVRASNPGQFESDAELCWQKGSVSDSIYHTGRCGINTDRPDEALTVHGNLRLTGHIIQPSDRRAKEAIRECDTREQLRNVQQIRVVHYRYTDDFARQAGLPVAVDTGVIAQEVQSILPEAVRTAGDIVLDNGTKLDNFLVVNRDRLFMENVGAVKELCKVTDNLENRIDELERMNRRLTSIKRLDSLKSISSALSSSGGLGLRGHRKHKGDPFSDSAMCSNKVIQITIVILVLIMAFCLVAMATLYFLEFQKKNNYNDHEFSFKQMVTHRQAHISIDTTSRPTKHHYKAVPTPYNKKTTTVAPHRKHKGDREDHVEKPTSAPARAPVTDLLDFPPAPLGRPPQCESLDCPTYCCRPEPEPAAPHAGVVSPVAPPTDGPEAPDVLPQGADPLTKAPPVVLNSNSLAGAARSQRAADEPRDNLYPDFRSEARQEHQGLGPWVRILGSHINQTVGPELCHRASPGLSRCLQRTAANYSYLIPLSRYLSDHAVELQFHFPHSWQRAQPCAAALAPSRCSWGWSKAAAPAPAPAPGQVVEVDPSSSPADAAAKQHLVAGPGPGSGMGVVDRHVVEVGQYLSTSAVLRVPLSKTLSNLCQLPANRLGVDFLEYNFLLRRSCRD